jgi:glycosyltransferase involved in cell wall biosynthesis
VASNFAGIPELLHNGRCGVLVPPKDVKALVTAIGLLFTGEAVCQRFADAAREYAEAKFDLWRNGQRLAALLCSMTRLERINSQS